MVIDRIECLNDVPIPQDGSNWSRAFKKSDGWTFTTVGVPSGGVPVINKGRKCRR